MRKTEQDNVVEKVEEILKKVMDMIKEDAEVKVSYVKSEKKKVEKSQGSSEEYEERIVDYIQVDIKGDSLGALIGYKGQNLSSLQYIMNLIVRRQFELENVRILLDVNEYKKEQEGRVREIAEARISELRESEEKEIELPPMSSRDRRIVHMLAQELDDITSESVGVGRDRRVKLTISK